MNYLSNYHNLLRKLVLITLMICSSVLAQSYEEISLDIPGFNISDATYNFCTVCKKEQI